MALEDIALFLLVVPFMYKGGFNWLERLIQVVAFIYVWIAHHDGNMSRPHVIFALVLTLLIIAVGQMYHDEIIDDWKYGIPYVFFIAFFFWKTLPSVSMNVKMTNRIEWEAILIFVAMNITIMAFWLQSFKKTQRSQQLEQLADYDSLTGTKSYTLFQREAKELFKVARTKHQDLAVVEMDIDRFKQINDFYGHSAGNQVLIEVTATVQNVLERLAEEAEMYRTGGEEFTIVFPNKTIEQALPTLRECWSVINRSEFFYQGNPIDVSISMGGTDLSETDANFEEPYNRADQYLYMSKRNGRNQITIEGKQRFAESKKNALAMLNAFFTQPVIDISADSKVVQTGLLTKVYDYGDSKWRASKDLKVSMRTQLKVIDGFKNRSKLGRIGLMISIEDFINEQVLEILKQYLRQHQDIDGFTVEIIDFETLANMEGFRQMSAQYRAAKIKIIVTNISDISLDPHLESGLRNVDGIKYAMQNERLEETNQATFQNATKWAQIARKYDIDFILDGVETSKDVQFAREELNARYLQGYYFGIPDLPVLT